MSSVPSFPQMPYARPSLEAIERSAADRQQAWSQAESSERQAEIIHSWDTGRIELDTQRALAFLGFELDTRDPAAKAEKRFFDDAGPRLTELDLDFVRKVLASPWRAELESHFGAHALALWEVALKTYDPVIADDRRRESEVTTSYTELLAAIRVPFRGKEYTLSTLGGFYGDPDRQTRLEVQQARFAAIAEHGETLDATFDELVRLRDGMARKLGLESFVPLAYALMRRTDYGPSQVAEYRRQVREIVVPLASRIRRSHAAALGVDDLAFHDHFVRDRLGVPRPQGGHDWMLDQAASLFGRLGDDFSEFFALLRDRQLMDLQNREGKAGGGFCLDLPKYGVPFVFANFNGTEDDVNVFTHECGHAFQAWRSMTLPLSDYFVPTYEAAEIHSMSLEMLCHPHVDLFFGDDAERYRIGHLEKAILFIPYGTAIDEFQHRVYEEPSLTPDQRAELWRDLEATYLPDRKYVGMPLPESGRFWQLQRHVYLSPFYYIDYCLAQTCALQFWHRARSDREEAMAAYRRLCELGGSKAFTGLVEDVGLISPFEDGCLAEVVESVESVIEA